MAFVEVGVGIVHFGMVVVEVDVAVVGWCDCSRSLRGCC